MNDALSLPVCFVGFPNWHVIRWIVEHKMVLIVWGLRWVALSLFFAVLWRIALGARRDDDD